jgi:hypothetical protein
MLIHMCMYSSGNEVATEAARVTVNGGSSTRVHPMGGNNVCGEQRPVREHMGARAQGKGCSAVHGIP